MKTISFLELCGYSNDAQNGLKTFTEVKRDNNFVIKVSINQQDMMLYICTLHNRIQSKTNQTKPKQEKKKPKKTLIKL